MTERGRTHDAVVSVTSSALAVAVALGISLAVIQLSGESAGDAASALWDGAFGSRNQIAGTLTKMVPLTLTAIAWIVAFTARRINVGLEGQMLAGGSLAAIVGLHVEGLPRLIHLPLAVLAGITGGAALGAIAAWLWARRNVNDFIATLLLNFVMIQLVSWLVQGPMEEPTGTLGQSEPVSNSARWPILLDGTILRWDFVLMVACVVLTAIVLRSTLVGFWLRLTGSSERAARAAGVNTIRIGVGSIVASAAFAGLAGSSLILASPSGNLAPGFSSAYGFDGIVVALLARNSVVGCLPAALLLAAMRQGGGLMEARVGISAGLVTTTQGLVILFVTGAGWWVRRSSARKAQQSVLELANAPVQEHDTAARDEPVWN